MQHVRIRVTGKVQGVSFRDTARTEALNLGIHGFARNEPDGSVYIEAEGNDEVIRQFLAWCYQGSRDAVVENVEHSTHDLVGPAGFEIH
jgi:acylphosphatase